MKKFGIVFRYEMGQVMKGRFYRVVTLLLMVALFVGLSIPRFTGGGEEAGQSPAAQEGQTGAALVYYDPGAQAEVIQSVLTQALPGVAFTRADAGGEALAARIEAGEADFALEIRSVSDYTYIVMDADRYGVLEATVGEAMRQAMQAQMMLEDGLDAAQVEAVMTATPEASTQRIGGDPMSTFWTAYVMIFLLYMAIILYGSMVASGVGAEKSTRAMELLITSAKPTQLMFGKVLGLGSAGLLQLLLILFAGKLSFLFNQAYWAANPIVTAIFDMSPVMMGYMLLFFILGFFVYAFLYGAVGSLINSTEELSSAIMPITLLYVAVFMVVITGTTGGSVDSGVMLIASFVPFSSPMAMYARIVMGHPALWEILLSIGILIASVILIGYGASGVYRLGTLMYGQKPNLKTLWRAVRRKEG